MILKSPAKINLFLNIIGKRKDGYHEIQTYFQLINLFDEIHISEISNSGVIFKSNNENINPNDNLCITAANLLSKKIGRNSIKGIEIDLQKNIPIGAGLGGGSSNAASVLLGLNKLWECNLSKKDLISIGKELGADVPVFINGSSAYAKGIGSEIEDFYVQAKFFLLVYPLINVSTNEMYKKFSIGDCITDINLDNMHENIGFNSFEAILCEEYPEINSTLSLMRKHNNGYVSGSGSCLYSIFDKEEDARNARELFPSEYQTYIVHSLNKV